MTVGQAVVVLRLQKRIQGFSIGTGPRVRGEAPRRLAHSLWGRWGCRLRDWSEQQLACADALLVLDGIRDVLEEVRDREQSAIVGFVIEAEVIGAEVYQKDNKDGGKELFEEALRDGFSAHIQRCPREVIAPFDDFGPTISYGPHSRRGLRRS